MLDDERALVTDLFQDANTLLNRDDALAKAAGVVSARCAHILQMYMK